MADEKKNVQEELPESRNFIHAFIEEDIAPGGQFEGMTVHTRQGGHGVRGCHPGGHPLAGL